MASSAERSAFWVGTAAFLFSCIAWGMNIPMTSVIFEVFDPYFLTAVRVPLATAVLIAIFFATRGRGALVSFAAPREAARTGVLLAAFFFLYTMGLRYTHPITAATVMAGAPVYTALVLRVASHVPLERGFWGAALMTLVGAGIVIWGRAHDTGHGLTVGGGEVLLVLALVSWTLYSILSQRLFGRDVPQLQRTCVSMVGASFWVLVFWALLFAAGATALPVRSPTATAVTYVLMTAVLSTGIGNVTWNIGVSRLGLATGSVWQNSVPVFGVLISMLFGIIPTVEQVLGGTIVLVGVLYLQWQRAKALRQA